MIIIARMNLADEINELLLTAEYTADIQCKYLPDANSLGFYLKLLKVSVKYLFYAVALQGGSRFEHLHGIRLQIQIHNIV
ncbi:hypothetical protein SDC9_144064 [bioreactor metagenome]|uniref:Uncharacterized protein n=1 Tax=bioreactor metagenome TaxID=1076179 RepID=A0A645E6F9_9ZZZZ